MRLAPPAAQRECRVVNAYVEIVGFIASVVSFVLWWPQAALVWRCRGGGEQLSAVSMSSQSLLLINAALWGAYAIGTGSLWVGAPGVINGPLAILTIVLLRRARQQRPRTPAHGLSVPDVRGLPGLGRCRTRSFRFGGLRSDFDPRAHQDRAVAWQVEVLGSVGRTARGGDEEDLAPPGQTGDVASVQVDR